ncbi:uncharacterized protein LOC117579791 [Drosophila guanche]|uniref:F-box domain-containing protein n=1 Tax=Drosophila guanche TaxID=7266 RepID=A0A3B0JZ77_DROGU|nr:uncharacterized protein LOC117579791 [Drosophila guanche]SPP76418.1 Hypothetical predicted protein [Drosophila guanche]
MASDNEDSPSSPTGEIAEILKLNDDCLEEIFERLPDLQTEIYFSQVCQRFQNISLGKWRISHTYDTMDLEKWRELLPNFEDLYYFIHLLQPYIKEMYVSSCLCTLLKDLDEIHITELPQVTSFYYDPEDVDCYPSNRSIRKLTLIVPGVRRLRLTTPTDGRYLSHFKHLEELHLYEDQHKAYELRQQYLDEVCHRCDLKVLDIRTFDGVSKLRLNNCVKSLQSLTTLKLNLSTIKSVLPEIMKLPALKQLVVLLCSEWHIPAEVSPDWYDPKIREVEEFYAIMEQKAKEIICVAVDGYYMPLEPGWDKNLPIWPHKNLQRLAICSWDHSTDYLERYTCMKDLQLLCLRNCTHLNDDVLLKFVDLCPRLQQLDVSYCREVTPSFLSRALKILKQKDPHRQNSGYCKTPPLFIFYVLSGFEEYVDKENLKTSPDYKDYIVFKPDFPVRSERGLSFVDRGYQFEFI